MERSNKNREEQLQQENEFLKMKLMLEKGAHFGSIGNNPLPPEVENLFLKQVIAFETGLENRPRVKLFDRLGQPGQFPPHGQIPDHEMEQAWESLLEFLNRHQIELSVCSPNIGARELYRFTTEELFDVEVEAVAMPGMVHCFIYDDFYPDPEYDNSRMVQEDLLPEIFRKEPIRFDFGFVPGEILFNKISFGDFDDLSRHLNQFKRKFDHIRLLNSRVETSRPDGPNWRVKGTLQAEFRYSGNAEIRTSSFNVLMVPCEGPFWVIQSVQIPGLDV